ncbi:PEP-CTERM sorting domain-containing protein [Paucibacter soli]|uniref:PEP-CTERM sorting domain-containing protein n=1 Tax=Paucibacter soli TaxID=3133433 RepID=UPI0030951D72
MSTKLHLPFALRPAALAASLLLAAPTAHPLVTVTGAFYGRSDGYLPRFPRQDLVDPSLALAIGITYEQSVQPGSFSAMAGSRVELDSFSTGGGGNAGTHVSLGGVGTRMWVGRNFGLLNSMSVTDGAVLIAGYSGIASWPQYLGQGELTVSGKGSRARFSWLSLTSAQVRVINGGAMETSYDVALSDARSPGSSPSRVLVQGKDSSWYGGPITVGMTGNSRVDITDTGLLAPTMLAVGAEGGNGAVMVDGPGSLLNGLGTNAWAYIARSGGDGTIELSNQAGLLGFERIEVGTEAGSMGRLNVLSKSTLQAHSMSFGMQAGTGNLMLDGPGSRVELDAVGASRFVLGKGGIGVAIVRGGAMLDAKGKADACVGRDCGAVIGALAGSSADFYVTGPGSEARFLGNFNVGGTGLTSYAWEGGGTPGGKTHASVSVLNGGALWTQQVHVGGWPSTATGLESSASTLNIDGDGSQWWVTGSTSAGLDALVSSATQKPSDAQWKISKGGVLLIHADTGREAHLRIAHGGGTSDFLVEGVSPLDSSHASRLSLIGQVASINVGENGGTGSLTIKAGAQTFVQGVTDSYVNIGMPGSTGEVLVAGGELSWPRRINVGAGGKGTLLISDKGQVRSNTALADGALHPSLVRISGEGSRWLITGDSTAGVDALVSTATRPNSTANWEVLDGGELRIEAATGREAHLRIAHGGGTSDFLVKGVSPLDSSHASRLSLIGQVASINVGENGGTGTLTIKTGAQTFVQGVTDSYVNIGMPGSTGEVLVAGGELSWPRRINVGAGGKGTLLISDKGQVRSNTALADGALQPSLVRISGEGSRWLITGDGTAGVDALVSTATRPNSTANWEVLDGGELRIEAAAGREAHLRIALGGGTSTLQLRDKGASLNVIGKEASIHVGENGGTGVLEIGPEARTSIRGASNGRLIVGMPGSNGTVKVGGTGELLVSAPGSNSFIIVGTGSQSHGRLRIFQGGLVSTTAMGVGEYGAQGLVDLEAGTLRLDGAWRHGVNVGASLAVGDGGGTGEMTLAKHSQLSIHADGTERGNLSVGGAYFAPGGTGTLTVSSGSSVSVTGGGGGQVLLGSTPAGAGTLSISGASSLTTNYIGVAAHNGADTGGQGSLLVQDSSSVNADTIEIGVMGFVGGTGTLNANIINRGIFSPGNSPGTLTVNGSFVSQLGGRLVLEVASDGQGGFITDQLIFGVAPQLDGLQINFRFLGHTDPNAFQASGGFQIDRFLSQAGTPLNHQLLSGASYSASSDSYLFSSFRFSADAGAVFQAQPVPEPQTWALWLLGLVAIGWRKLRRARPNSACSARA